MAETQYLCTKCETPIKADRVMWLELNTEDGLYYYYLPNAHMPEEQSQGMFPFGRDCGYKVSHTWRE